VCKLVFTMPCNFPLNYFLPPLLLEVYALSNPLPGASVVLLFLLASSLSPNVGPPPIGSVSCVAGPVFRHFFFPPPFSEHSPTASGETSSLTHALSWFFKSLALSLLMFGRFLFPVSYPTERAEKFVETSRFPPPGKEAPTSTFFFDYFLFLVVMVAPQSLL